MKKKVFILKRVGKIPTPLYILLMVFIVAAPLAFVVSFGKSDTSFLQEFCELGIFALIFMILYMIHPVVLREDGKVVLIHFFLPFQKTINVQDIIEIKHSISPVLFGHVEMLSLCTEKGVTYITISDTEVFCSHCLKINPNIQISAL